MQDLCNEMVKIHTAWGTVSGAVAERLRVLGEEVEAIGLKEKDQRTIRRDQLCEH